MNRETNTENTINYNNKLLLIDEYLRDFDQQEVDYIRKNFCGKVINENDIEESSSNNLLYICGDIEAVYNKVSAFKSDNIYVIKDLSYNIDVNDNNNKYTLIDIGAVPINLHNVGVYFRSFFDGNKDYFTLIENEHKFQSLTESNKPNNAFRKGIYLTNVVQNATDTDSLKFNLLRCSSNLDGPTENFRETDREVVDKVNHIASFFFDQKATLNHVLAQIYENHVVVDGDREQQKKAKIKEHSDKTKDMPRNALMAFCTFYNGLESLKQTKASETNRYDYTYKGTSVLTSMRFRLKPSVKECDHLVKQFDVPLYPNSVFLISLWANRLYTHEVMPSILPVDKIPTRMGYVIRCSNKEAVHKNGKTYVLQDGNEIELVEPDPEGVTKLKNIYYEENMNDNMVYYDNFYFSLNSGDYLKPTI